MVAYEPRNINYIECNISYNGSKNIFVRYCFNWNIEHTSTVADTLSFAAIDVNWVAYTVPYGES